MSRFEEFNPENKLRLPLTFYAEQILETDCANFTLRRSTLINIIILNYYQTAECSIGLCLKKYAEELRSNFKQRDFKKNETAIQTILNSRKEQLIEKYTKRKSSDVNWQITLNKRVKELLTMDSSTNEEQYYGNKPSLYIRSLVEEYTQLSYFQREAIVFQDILNTAQICINNNYQIKLVTNRGSHLIMKPYKIDSDPLSMYHYLIGYVINNPIGEKNCTGNARTEKVQSIRISRLTHAEMLPYHSAHLSFLQKQQLLHELKIKGVQFVSGDESSITVWLSDFGIKKYNSQLHLRPIGIVDTTNPHIYTFECTEAQILYYFFSFGCDAKIISPTGLADRFMHNYQMALDLYKANDI